MLGIQNNESKEDHIEVVVSVVIATYEMSGRGRHFLNQALESIYDQDFSELEVVISDDSENDEIEKECVEWSTKLKLKYFHNSGPRISASKKFNIGIDLCEGSIIKILCQDDLLSSSTAISQTVAGLSNGHKWLVSSYFHIDENNEKLSSHVPKLNRRIERVNTIGSHSGLAFVNGQEIQHFDEELLWRMDCELYRRFFDIYGEPFFLLTETVCVRQWSGQATNSIVQKRDRIREFVKVARKYPRKLNKNCS
jgi:glycosyltransferase involved in cell wall biosynthesis